MNKTRRNKKDLRRDLVVLAITLMIMAAMTVVPLALLRPTATKADNPPDATLTGINFDSREYYEGEDITSEGLTITVKFSDGTEHVLSNSEYTLYVETAGHTDTVVQVETPYGIFDWTAPVVPVASVTANYSGVAYAGKEVAISDLPLTVEYENGHRALAKWSLTELPGGTVSLGSGDSFSVIYDGVTYNVVAP